MLTGKYRQGHTYKTHIIKNLYQNYDLQSFDTFGKANIANIGKNHDGQSLHEMYIFPKNFKSVWDWYTVVNLYIACKHRVLFRFQ